MFVCVCVCVHSHVHVSVVALEVDIGYRSGQKGIQDSPGVGVIDAFEALDVDAGR